ncbi:MAG: hypothetical protein HKO62_06620, partial [Gammaproteobacteria bacterium]|nr:hypothetical protein [Gammaproteobacteria bacterium]
VSVPIVGFQYLRETERYLQSALADSLSATANALAYSMSVHAGVFQGANTEDSPTSSLFIHPLTHNVQVDGYLDDWTGYLDWSTRYSNEAMGSLRDPRRLSFRALVGRYGDSVYLLIQVDDSDLRFDTTGTGDDMAGDTIELVLPDSAGNTRHLFFSTAAPGAVTPYQVIEHWDFTRTRESFNQVIGAWQAAGGGYSLEIRIPARLVGSHLGLLVHDVDTPKVLVESVGTAGPLTATRPGRLLRTSAQLEARIVDLRLPLGRRVWVLNRHGQVLASGGSLGREPRRDPINFVYTWLLPSAHDNFDDDLAGASRLRGQEVNAALAGTATTRWRSSPDGRAVIVSAAHPVYAGNERVGAVVIEETTNSIQTLQRRAMADLFNLSLALFVLVTLLLLWFASRVSLRLVRLRDAADAAIDASGRVVGDVATRSDGDEIDDLSVHIASMLERLRQYNSYLEAMARRLAHELRTPISVVQTSLENLAEDDRDEPALQRARDGTARLQDLVRRLSEAARLEQSIAAAELAAVDLTELVTQCVSGYRSAWPAVGFELSVPDTAATVRAAPELVVQLLDKLIDNAVDFTPAGETIRIHVQPRDDAVALEVRNPGPPLPEGIGARLFDSMVAQREQGGATSIHMGLGLYIARLIMDFHGGSISAENTSAPPGVLFRASFPAGR